MGDNTTEAITPFLKARRAALDPKTLGFGDGLTRRRVHGLRREEVAQRAGISVDYYTRIEQGRAHGTSDSVLDAIARALQLTGGEHSYLRNITRPTTPQGEHSCELANYPRATVPRAAQELLDALDPAGLAGTAGRGAESRSQADPQSARRRVGDQLPGVRDPGRTRVTALRLHRTGKLDHRAAFATTRVAGAAAGLSRIHRSPMGELSRRNDRPAS